MKFLKCDKETKVLCISNPALPFNTTGHRINMCSLTHYCSLTSFSYLLCTDMQHITVAYWCNAAFLCERIK